MNCTLCKYRVQIVGFEQQVGEPQQAHHLQVRGLPEGASQLAELGNKGGRHAIVREPNGVEVSGREAGSGEFGLCDHGRSMTEERQLHLHLARRDGLSETH